MEHPFSSNINALSSYHMPVKIVREPDSEQGKNKIACYAGKMKLGYMPIFCAKFLSPAIDKGLKLKAYSCVWDGKYIDDETNWRYLIDPFGYSPGFSDIYEIAEFLGLQPVREREREYSPEYIHREFFEFGVYVLISGVREQDEKMLDAVLHKIDESLDRT